MMESGRLARIAPGLARLSAYRIEWLPYNVAAGLSVAAVALPIAIAYAQLAGFPPVVGLYAAILPLVVYAALGTSPQLSSTPTRRHARWSRPADAVLGRSGITRVLRRRDPRRRDGRAGPGAVPVQRLGDFARRVKSALRACASLPETA